MRITQWGEYATQFCIYFAQNAAKGRELISGAEIAKGYEIDLLYAQQILQRLRKNNLIESIRGPLGGYKLSRSASEITLKDILYAAEGDTLEVICETKPINATRCSPNIGCSLRSVWHELKDHVDVYLKNKTLAELSIEKNTDEKLTQIGN